MMARLEEQPAVRDQENADPQELHRPVPKTFLLVVALLLSWAVYYIATQQPGLGASSAAKVKQAPPAAPTAQSR